jgi:hypothetical protein
MTLVGSAGLAVAAPGITVQEARIGCLDIQQSGNMTNLVGQACNGKMSCAYKAPTEDAYKKAGVSAATRSFCTQAMEIKYQCAGFSQTKVITVPGDAFRSAAHRGPEGFPPPLRRLAGSRLTAGADSPAILVVARSLSERCLQPRGPRC